MGPSLGGVAGRPGAQTQSEWSPPSLTGSVALLCRVWSWWRLVACTPIPLCPGHMASRRPGSGVSGLSGALWHPVDPGALGVRLAWTGSVTSWLSCRSHGRTCCLRLCSPPLPTDNGSPGSHQLPTES